VAKIHGVLRQLLGWEVKDGRLVWGTPKTHARTRGWVGPAGLHPHELRHTAASLAIASGADVKVVQMMLGHKTATMTLDLYGHLLPDRLDDLAGRMDSAVCAPDVPLTVDGEDGADPSPR
jgi:hypothetical protein